MGIGAGVLGLLILTTTLPNALAPTHPGAALWLDAGHSRALRESAHDQHVEWLKLAPVPTKADPNPSPLPPAQIERRAALAASLRDSAERILAREPANASAHRLLGELAEDAEDVRGHMQTALANSRREWVAALWLMRDAAARQKPVEAIHYADLLLRAHPQRLGMAMRELAALAEDATARPALATVLAHQPPPPWRRELLRRLPRHVRDLRNPLALMLALNAAGSPPTAAEQEPYLNQLLNTQLGELAYYTWLQFLPPETRATLELVTNGGFEGEPSGLPFDWKISGKPANVSVRIEDANGPALTTGQRAGSRMLHVEFGNGRVQFPAVDQLLALSPGRYELTGQQLVNVTAVRGLRWRLSCLAKAAPRLGETEMATGFGRAWQSFTLTVEVPADGSCPVQKLHLVHDARSASEQFAKGEAWFDNLRLRWITP